MLSIFFRNIAEHSEYMVDVLIVVRNQFHAAQHPNDYLSPAYYHIAYMYTVSASFLSINLN